ncbi:hypothetical protein GCM10023321_04470 [Pseudonocardia eucalypti]|uniref:Uncharacterized protein n=1 Tax=Pseudonocardia eucalypti TaxID=648755 RepID=A0ABP9PFS9_9PSEU|nr:hypothetical protein [Pseudonocardia eucalypti]
MSNERSGELDGGTEPPEWRTDPMLPVITDDMLPPLETPHIPRLDDHNLADLLAELDDEKPSRPAPPVYAPRCSPEADEDRPPRPECLPRVAPDEDGVDRDGPAKGRVDEDRLTEDRIIEDSAAGPKPARPTTNGNGTAAMAGPRPAPTPPVIHSEYGDFRPPIHQEPDRHYEALSLTGITERSRGRLGSRLFTIAFVVIFVLILIQAAVSLLSPS